MRVLVLGGSGFVGREVVRQLQQTTWALPIVASRRPMATEGIPTTALDTRDANALKSALAGVDAVVNCVAGDGVAIAQGAKCLADAALETSRPLIVHMSTMSVYGSAEGQVSESSATMDNIGWYGHAKIDAEAHMQRYHQLGGKAVVLRPGCVIGAGSYLWVERIGLWLKAARLGNLGVLADGPANLVDVKDVAHAVVSALGLKANRAMAPVFNLVSPDSPRWNTYFEDFAIAIEATPLRFYGKRRMQLDAYAMGVPLKILERLLGKLKWEVSGLPIGIPPSLLRLWGQQITLKSALATDDLTLAWTPYVESLESSSRWFQSKFR